MYLVLSSLILSVTWVYWTWAYAVHRRPVPAPWTQVGAASTAVVLVLVMFVALGVGGLVAFAFAPMESLRELNAPMIAVALAAPVAAALLVPVLRRRLNPSADLAQAQGVGAR